MNRLKPLAYGYMRVSCDVRDQAVRAMEEKIRRHAEERDYCFGTIFYEFVSGSQSAFGELAEEHQRADAHVVIVPSLRHLSKNTLLLNCMLTRLEPRSFTLIHNFMIVEFRTVIDVDSDLGGGRGPDGARVGAGSTVRPGGAGGRDGGGCVRRGAGLGGGPRRWRGPGPRPSRVGLSRSWLGRG